MGKGFLLVTQDLLFLAAGETPIQIVRFIGKLTLVL